MTLSINFLRRKSASISWLIFSAFAVVHFINVVQYSVNIPFWDEWFEIYGLDRSVNWNWIFSFHNEHRIVFTKLIMWLSYRLEGWNLRSEIIVNFFFYLGILAALTLLKNVTLGSDRLKTWPLFLTFLMSISAHENLMWGFQSQFHLVLLFTLMAMYFFFCREKVPANSSRCLWIGTAFLVLGMYSFSSGVVGALILFPGASIFWWTGNKTSSVSRKAKQLSGPFFLLAASLLAWFHGYQRSFYVTKISWPWSWAFWKYFFHLIARGFGFQAGFGDVWIGGVFLLAAAWGLAYLLKNRQRSEPAAWIWALLGVAIMGMLSAISLGRAGLGMDHEVGSRYSQIASLLIFPCLVIGYLVFEKKSFFSSNRFLTVFFLLLLLGYYPDFRYSGYRMYYYQRTDGVECVKSYYQGTGNGVCPILYQEPLKRALDFARLRQMSFTH